MGCCRVSPGGCGVIQSMATSVDCDRQDDVGRNGLRAIKSSGIAATPTCLGLVVAAAHAVYLRQALDRYAGPMRILSSAQVTVATCWR